jgi:hypothetical protein
MAIDRYALMDELHALRVLAAARWEEDPLPVGRAATERLQQEIEQYDMHKHIVQLDTDGYTVLPPGKAGSPELIERLKAAMLRLSDRDTGYGKDNGLGATLYHMLPEDRAFEEALMSPQAQVLVTYLLGYRAKLSQSTGLIKERGVPALGLHADHSAKFAAPWSALSNYSVVTWVLTDYKRENGGVCVWPGSHKWGKPVPQDMVMAHVNPERDHPEIKVLEVPAGSVIAWHGSLWHGAVPRTADGKRMTLVFPHVRDPIAPQEMYWASTTKEMIARNPPRFSTLMGLTTIYGWLHNGPDVSNHTHLPWTGSPFE